MPRLDSQKIETIVRFSQKNPHNPVWPEKTIRQFLSSLISSEKLMFEIADDHGSVAFAVLIDLIQNPANQACLEVLGIRNGVDSAKVLEQFVGSSAKQLPPEKSGFQVTVSESIAISDDWIKRNKLELYYETFEMVHNRLSEVVNVTDSKITAVNDIELHELYAVLCESFKNNPDTSIPPFEEWKSNRLKNPTNFTSIFKDEGRIVGFINLHLNGNAGEVRTLGVLPSAQKKGVGRQLLLHGLNKLREMGILSCELTVATQNQGALGLYQGLGFQTVERYRVFSRQSRR